MSSIGKTLDALVAIIANRRKAGDESYTHRLLTGKDDDLLKKVVEEAGEVVLAAKDSEVNHLRYEVADVIFHLLVVLERYDISLDDLAAELNTRMTEEERPAEARLIPSERVRRR